MESKDNYGDYTSYLPPQDRPTETEYKGAATESVSEAPKDNQGQPQVPVKERLDGAINGTADQLRNFAQKLEGYGRPGTKTEEVTDKLADQLHRGAKYLESTDVDTLSDQLEGTIRKQPLASLGVAFGVGFIIARILRR